MKRWHLYILGLALAVVGAVVVGHLARELILAREEARQAEKRTEFVTDSVRTVIEGADKEIKAAQKRITELTMEAVEIAEDLEESKADADSAIEVVEAALPNSLKHLARRLQDAHKAERLDWARTVANRDSTIAEKDVQLAQKDVQLAAKDRLILTQTDEIAKWKKAANASFKFSVGSTVVTAGVASALTALLIVASGS